MRWTHSSSKLLIRRVSDKRINLLKKCVKDVENTLLVKPEIHIHGRTVNQSRDVGFYSDAVKGYHYSGRLMESQPLTKSLQRILRYVNKRYKSNYNGILINRYRGKDKIGKHSDDERNLDANAGVISISFGGTRIFRVRDKNTGEILQDFTVRNGDLMRMYGDFQKQLTHEVMPPRVKDIRLDPSFEQERYSLTFRSHQN